MNIKKLAILIMIAISMLVTTNYVYADQNSTTNETNIEYSYPEYQDMSVEISGAEISSNSKDKVVSTNIEIKNANYVVSGALQIIYDTNLEFVGIENKNSNYTMDIAINKEKSMIVIPFSSNSNEGQVGDLTMCTLKFKVPEKIKQEQYYNIEFGSETKLITSQTIGNGYNLYPGVVHYQKSESKFSIVIIIAGIIIILLIIMKILKLQKKSRRIR